MCKFSKIAKVLNHSTLLSKHITIITTYPKGVMIGLLLHELMPKLITFFSSQQGYECSCTVYNRVMKQLYKRDRLLWNIGKRS